MPRRGLSAPTHDGGRTTTSLDPEGIKYPTQGDDYAMTNHRLPLTSTPRAAMLLPMRMWAPIWSGIVDSTIWEEKDHVFRVFVGMLALKDHDHIVRYDAYKLARRMHLDLELVLDAIRVLSAPDDKRPGQEYDGRRIHLHEEGWLVLNGQRYQEMMQAEMQRRRWRKAQAKKRAKEAEKKKGKPKPFDYGSSAMHDAPSVPQGTSPHAPLAVPPATLPTPPTEP